MSKELGVGTRVRIGWVPDDKVEGLESRLKTGTIAEGPFGAGHVMRLGDEIFRIANDDPVWRVSLDDGYSVAAVETIIFPIDDDDASEREAEKPRETNLVV